MSTHSSILVWKIPCSEEPGGLQSVGLQRVGRDGVHTHSHTQISGSLPERQEAAGTHPGDTDTGNSHFGGVFSTTWILALASAILESSP